MAVQRVGPEEVRRKMQGGEDLLLVCAYESDEKFRQAALEGAIPLSEFQAREASVPKDREIVFY